MVSKTQKNTTTDKNSPDNSRQKKIQTALLSLKLNPQSIQSSDQLDDSTKRYIPTGVTELDALLGPYQGIKEGTILELSGENSSGKSYVALKMSAEAQKMGLRVAWMDVENSYSNERALSIGVQVNDINTFEVYSELGVAENWSTWIKDRIESKEYGLVVIDSLTALIPKDNYVKTDYETPTIGAHAKFCNKLLASVLESCRRSGTILVLINQLRYIHDSSSAVRGSMIASSPGGKAVEFFPSTRFRFRRLSGKSAEIIGDNNDTIGGRSHATLIKSRQGRSMTTTEFPLYYEKVDVNYIKDIIHRCLNSYAIKESKCMFTKYKYLYYVDMDTGEVLIKTKDYNLFVKELLKYKAPSSLLNKKNLEENAFDCFCRILKISDKTKQDTIKAVEEYCESVDLDESDDDIDENIQEDEEEVDDDLMQEA